MLIADGGSVVGGRGGGGCRVKRNCFPVPLPVV